MTFRDATQPIPEYVRGGFSHFRVYSHLSADTMEELHAVAERIGLKRAWFQGQSSYPHYDLFGSEKIARADAAGVVMLPRREFFVRLRDARRQREAQPNGLRGELEGMG
jgi:hypothetical protein